MKPVFNSLGSNYSPSFINLSRSLLINPRTQLNDHSLSQLTRQLETTFSGKAFLFYKGRQAITFALQSHGLGPQDQILTQAFTCYAVEQGIKASNTQPIFTDIDKHSLNLSVTTLTQALKRASNPKAILIQHTFGQPADIKSIRQFCNQHHLILIENLTHSFGSTDKQGKPLGHYADTVVISFGRDKIIDAVSGGACITKNLAAASPTTSPISKSQTAADLVYPSLTTIIRNTNHTLPGKLLHRLLRHTPLLTNPIKSASHHLQSLPSTHAQLVLHQLQTLPSQLQHRRTISKIYHRQLKSNQHLDQNLYQPNTAYLRFPVLITNRSRLLNHLKHHHIYIADSWYRQPVETSRLKVNSSYTSGSCPNAEHLSQHIVNLPTHINITATQAKHLCQLINQFNA